MIDEGLKCPFCGGTVWIAVCDDEGNLHPDVYAEDPWSGLSYVLIHSNDDVPKHELCPVANEDSIGEYLFDNVEEAVVAWKFTSCMRNTDPAPCCVGDILWVNFGGNVFEVEVFETMCIDSIKYKGLVKARRFGVRGSYIIGDDSQNYMAFFNWNSIGKTIFYTKEDAMKGKS